jgi:Beta-lactamase superfamily domain
MATKIQTLGHGSLLLTDRQDQPLLLTDPWLVGSTYWRSWWLQHYPDEQQLEFLAQVKYVYITHEHPDHFHTPSIRKIGRAPIYLCPDLPDASMSSFLAADAFQAEVLKALQWRSLSPEVAVLSIPLWNDDSLLLIKTPDALIINLNDAKPNQKILKNIRAIRDGLEQEKVIVLSSYSPASIVNSFLRDDHRVHLKEKADYVKYLIQTCETLKADMFIPFASQVVFLRQDSQWANDYKVTYDDLKQFWQSRCELLPPYSTVDLVTGETHHVAPSDYRTKGDAKFNLIAQQEAADQQASFDEADQARLVQKMNSTKLLSLFSFRKGIGFSVNDQDFVYNPWQGSLASVARTALSDCSFWLKIPGQALKDALLYDHFGDLGPSMFIQIHLNHQTKPIAIYLFFILLTLNDYKHTKSLKNLRQWLLTTVKTSLFAAPKIPFLTMSSQPPESTKVLA